MCWNYQKRCRIFIKSRISPSHFNRYLQVHFFSRNLSLEYAFGSSNTKLKLLVILVILLFGLGPQSPIGLMYLMNRDLLELGFEFEKLERFNVETATGKAL